MSASPSEAKEIDRSDSDWRSIYAAQLSESVPAKWVVKTIGEVATIKTGKLDANAADNEGEYPFFTCAKKISRINTPAFDAEAVLVAGNGDFNVKYYSGKFNAYQRTYVLQDIKTLGKYLFYYIDYRLSDLTGDSRGSTIKYIRLGDLRDYPIPIAPLDQQLRIVAEIEKQFSRLDEAVANLKRVKANLKRYKAAVLKTAVEGKLTEDWRKQNPNIEPASKLLERILAERRAKWEETEFTKLKAKRKAPENNKWKEKYQAPETLDEKDLPVLPKGWVWIRLEQILESLRNGISAKPDQVDGLAILRISAVRPLTVNLSDVRYLPVDKSTEYASYQLNDGDLLFTRYNGNPDFVGVCGVVKQIETPTVHPDKIIRATVTNEIETCPSYLEMVLNAGESRAHIASMVRTTAGQSGVSGTDIKNIPVPIPPSAEQQLIVRKVAKEFSIIDSIEQQVGSIFHRAERLRQSVLTRSFGGEVS